MSTFDDDPLPPRRKHSVRQRQSKGIDDPESEFRKIVDEPARLLSSDSVWKQVQKSFEDSSDEEVLQTSLNISLICPISKRRTEVPARGRGCDIRHCFDLMTYLADKKAKVNNKDPVKFECPHHRCDAKLPLEDLRIDGLLREALENFDARVETVEIRPDGVFPVASQQNIPQESIDNDAVFGEVEEKPDPQLTVPGIALDKLLAAIENCVASLKDSEGDLVEKVRLVQGSLAEENGVPRARFKKPTSADRRVVIAKCKEIDGRLRQLKSKVEAHVAGLSADESRNISVLRSELQSVRDSYLEVVKALSTVVLPSSGPIRDAFAVLSECMTGLVEAARVTDGDAVRDAPTVGALGVEELAAEPPVKRARVGVEDEPATEDLAHQLQSAKPPARLEDMLSQEGVQRRLKHREAVNASAKRKRQSVAATSDGEEPVFKSRNAGHATKYEQNTQSSPVDRTESNSDVHLAQLTLNISNWNRDAKTLEQSIQRYVNKEGRYPKKAAGKPKMEAEWEANRQEKLADFQGRLQRKSEELHSEITVRIVYRALQKYYSEKHRMSTSSFVDHFCALGYSDPRLIVSHIWSIEKEQVRNALFDLCVKNSINDFIECPGRYDEWRAQFECRQTLDEFMDGITNSTTTNPET